MIKLIISDFDGVLLDLKEIHFLSLNNALMSVDEKFIISKEEHNKIFDGLSTKNKLKILSEIKGLSSNTFDDIFKLKQIETISLLKTFDNINHNIYDVILSLKQSGYLFYVASNAIRDTVDTGLKKLGIIDLVDKIYSNQDVKNSKPNPEIYLKCMADAGVSPHETLIIEDSRHGRDAAVSSGAYVCGVDNSFDFTLDRIKSIINTVKPQKLKWAGKSDLNILIPMAGSGSRFASAGYLLPKPLIDVNGKPMIQRVIDNLNIDANYIFIVQKEHYHKYNLELYLNLMAPNCKIILAGDVRQGAAWDSLLAKEFINNDSHLLIANSDQLVDWDSCDFMYSMINNNNDGGILTFNANDPKWSYAKVDEENNVCEVAEKIVISNNATVGIYYWRRGSDYVKCAEQMISKNIKTNNEFYICPTFNEAAQDNKKIKIFPIEKMHGLGTPSDLENYLLNNKD